MPRAGAVLEFETDAQGRLIVTKPPARNVVDEMYGVTTLPVTYLVAGLMFALVLATYVEPVRSRVPLVALMFSSFDRPEDRPHTLSWLSTQAVAGYLVLIPLLMSLTQLGVPELIYVPILINAVGDGLADQAVISADEEHLAVGQRGQLLEHHSSRPASAWSLARISSSSMEP